MSQSENAQDPRLPGQVRGTHDFEAQYRSGRPPWDIGRPQPFFRDLAERGRLFGHVLDVGCGTGEHALMAAALGLDATGVDASDTAIAIARRKADERGLQVRFISWNALDLADLGQSFDTVLDSGLFHVLEDHVRARFVEALRASMPVGATYHMLCFSDLEPGTWGPRRIQQDELRANFTEGWRIAQLEEAAMEMAIEPGSAHAWFASVERIT